MKNRVVLMGALLASTSLVVMGAGIDGKWTVEVPGRGGGNPTTQTLTLKSSGTTLTGSLDGGRGPTDITEGTIHDSDVAFKVVRQGQNGTNTTDYKGTLSGDELKLTVTREAAAGGGGGGGGGQGKGGGGGRGGPQELTFKRAK